MATMTAYHPGQFCWVDLMARDLQHAQDFYCSLFDWTAELQDTQGGPPYVIFKYGGQMVAGLGQMDAGMKSSGMPPIWSSYVNVEDADATVGRVAGLGGTVLMPVMDVLDAGQMAIIQDPSGAPLSLWQKKQHFGAELVNLPGSLVWNELITPEPEKVIPFYEQLFGWSIAKEESSEANYWNIKNNGRMNGGLMERTAEMGPFPPCWCTYFAVADISATVDRLQSLGGAICRPPFEVGVGHIAVVADNDGGVFNVIQMTVPPDE